MTPVLFSLFVTFSLESSSLILNPDQLDLQGLTSAKEPANAKTWIASAVRSLRVDHAFARPSEKWMKRHQAISRAYLQMNLEEAASESRELLAELSTGEPHSEWQKLVRDSMTILSLSSTEPPPEAAFFRKDQDFLRKLPMRYQAQWANTPEVASLTAEALENPLRVLIWGSEVKLPLRLTDGIYVIHALTSTELKTFRISVAPNGTLTSSLLKSENLWNRIAQAEMRRVLKLSHHGNGNLLLAVRTASGSPQILQISEAPRSVTPLMSFSEPLAEPKVAKEENLSWLRSPWFWAITAAAVGGISYGVFEASRDRQIKFHP